MATAGTAAETVSGKVGLDALEKEVTMETTQPATPARLPRKGKKSGPVTEYCALFHIKPGHAEQLIDEISAALARRGDVREAYASIGVHDARYVRPRQRHAASHHDQLRSGFRPLLRRRHRIPRRRRHEPDSAFAGSNILRKHPKAATTPCPGRSSRIFWSRTRRKRTSSRIPTTASVQEIRKALRVQQAFQQVLDHPEAAQALQHPALKPLLDEAAD